MFKKLYAVATTGLLLAVGTHSNTASAQSMGGACVTNFETWDMYSDGTYIGSFDKEVGQTCFYFDGGGRDPLGGGGGGGGSIDTNGGWVSGINVPAGSIVQINIIKRQVRTDLVNCSSDTTSLGQAATYYTTLPGNSNFPITGASGQGPYVTLITPDGRIDMVRFANGGSVQFKPKDGSECGGEGWTP